MVRQQTSWRARLQKWPRVFSSMKQNTLVIGYIAQNNCEKATLHRKQTLTNPNKTHLRRLMVCSIFHGLCRYGLNFVAIVVQDLYLSKRGLRFF